MAGLSAKIGADDREFTEILERSSRRFRSFGRELNEGARGIGAAFGESTKSLGKLGEGFKIAGAAAGVFAGVDGLIGIAGSLASGGVVLAGMAALTYAMHAFEADTEAAKSAVEEFNKELGKIPQSARGLAELRRIQGSLEGALNAKRAALAGQATPAISAVGAAGLGSEIARQGGFVEYIKGIFGKSNLEQTAAQLTQEVDATSKAADDLANALRTPEGQLKTMTERADKLHEVLTAMTGVAEGASAPREIFITRYLDAWAEVNDLVRQHGREVGKIGDIVRQLATDFKNTPMFDLRGAQAALASVNAVMGGALRPQQTNYAGPVAPGLGQIRAGNFIIPEPHEATILPEKVSEVTQTLKAGFAELPGALAGVLAPLLASVFGNNRGAQIGGALGGAFGTGAGGFLGGLAAHAMPGMIGAGIGSVIPIVGTAVGALLGGVIGSLFGGHKHEQALDTNTAALNHLAEVISNVPTGVKVANYRYAAADPSSGNQNPLPGDPFTPPGRGRGGGVAIHNLIINGVTDIPALIRKIGTVAQIQNGRGGSSSLRVALNPVRA